MKRLSDSDVVKEFYATLNRNDITTALSYFDPEIVRTEWEGTPSAGTFRGLDEIKAHLIEGRSTWAEGGCVPERLVVASDKVTAFVHVRVRLKDKTEWLDGNVTDIFTLRNGKITKFISIMGWNP